MTPREQALALLLLQGWSRMIKRIELSPSELAMVARLEAQTDTFLDPDRRVQLQLEASS